MRKMSINIPVINAYNRPPNASILDFMNFQLKREENQVIMNEDDELRNIADCNQ